MKHRAKIEIARFTSQVEVVTRFYTDVLGQPPDSAHAGLAVFTTDHFVLLIHALPEADPENPPSEDHIAFSSQSLDRDFHELSTRYDVIAPPKEYPWGRSAYLRDPDGRLIEMSQES